MVFSSIIFLFFFLPIVLAFALALQAIANRAGGKGHALVIANAWLVVASLAFYAWGEARLMWLLLFSCALNFAGGLLISRTDGRIQRLSLGAVVVANLVLLGGFKYSALAADLANRVNAMSGHFFGPGFSLPAIALPLGISFYTFHGISYVIDVGRRRILPTRSPLNFLCYYTLFPQLVAGPIVRYSQVAGSLTERLVGWPDLAEGARRFMLGLSKKTLIANQAAILADAVFALSRTDRSAGAAWIGLVAYALQIYFDFSGYTDMAVGMGRMLGFRFPENFNTPYAARSVRDFWRRWHMTLTLFLRDYLYIPLGGNREGSVRTGINLVLVFACCGLWHGASWNFLFWGLFHGFFLVAERILEPESRRAPAWLKPLGHVYTVLVILGGWVLFRCESTGQAVDYFQALFGGGAPGFLQALPWKAWSPDIIVAMVSGLVFSVPPPRALRSWRNRPGIVSAGVEGVLAVATLAVFVFSLASIGSGSHNPFIYYRF